MHVLPNGIVVALRRDRNSVQAFDSQLAEKIGEWKLPTGLRWLTLCGGGDGLFLVGLRNYTKAELHAFRTPAELKVEPKGADAAPKKRCRPSLRTTFQGHGDLRVFEGSSGGAS